MTEPETKTVPSQYGEATIQVVECDSCGVEVAVDDAFEFELSKKNAKVREGWACSHCVEEGPMSFPDRYVDEIVDYRGTLWFNVIAYPIVLVLSSVMRIGPLSEKEDKWGIWEHAYVTALRITLLWVVISLGVIGLFRFL